ncbi:MAG: hypothetical protein ACTTKO_07110 [Candidatus Limimorpha sp.]
MRQFIPLALACIVLPFLSCTRETTLFGTWTADKINMDFDEHKSTPELIKQLGEMEKGNRIVLSSDSTLQFYGSGKERTGRFSLRNDTLFCDGTAFGAISDGNIVTTEKTILGSMRISYKKKE